MTIEIPTEFETQPETTARRYPLYLSGAVREEYAAIPRLGFMRTPNMGNPSSFGRPWGADTGCFSAAGVRAFNLERYQRWLARQTTERGTCLFVTAPDRVGDPVATLELARPVLPLIRAAGFPAAFVLQDGAERRPELVPWGEFDVLFIGGTELDWKTCPGVAAVVREAKVRGLWVHVGRVNSEKRYRAMAAMGADSGDGTFLKHGPTVNLPRLYKWLGVAPIATPTREAA